MNYILAYNEDLTFNGFYVEGVHTDIPSTHIVINVELWEYLLNLGEFKLVDNFEVTQDLYTLDNIDLFEKVEREYEEIPKEPTEVETRIDALEEENAYLLYDSVVKDAKIDMLEQDLADLMFEIAIMRMNN